MTVFQRCMLCCHHKSPILTSAQAQVFCLYKELDFYQVKSLKPLPMPGMPL